MRRYQIQSVRPVPVLYFWRYARMKRCPLSGAYPEFVEGGLGARAPQGKFQILGSLYHSIQEEISHLRAAGPIAFEVFETLFIKKLQDQETEMKAEGTLNIFGSPKYWPEVGRYFDALADMVKASEKRQLEGFEIFAEKTFKSRDGKLAGVVDLVIKRGDYIEILDYKTGAIRDEEGLKSDYVEQLLLYAYLVQERLGVYPSRLMLVRPDGEQEEVQSSECSSKAVADRAREVLEKLNRFAQEGKGASTLAIPSEENCIYCQAKPYCQRFLENGPVLYRRPFGNFVWCRQIGSLEFSRNGLANFQVEVLSGTVASSHAWITKVPAGRFPHFKDRPGQVLLITDLRYEPVIGRADSAEVTSSTRMMVLEEEHG